MPAKPEGHCFCPSWSPDGKRLALVQGDRRGNTDIVVLDVATGRVRRLTDSNCINTDPSWNPAGTQLAFTSDREGGPQVFLMGDDGSNVRRLTQEGTYNGSPAWSPSGAMIAYVSRFEGKFDLFVYKLGEGKSYQITTGVASSESPSWSPDERRIVFTSGSRGGMQFYTTDLSGNTLAQVDSTWMAARAQNGHVPAKKKKAARISWVLLTLFALEEPNMRFVRNLIPLAVILTLGVGVACKKPAPAPAEPAAPAAARGPAQSTPTPRSALMRRPPGARPKPTPKPPARPPPPPRWSARPSSRPTPHAALKDINFEFDKSDIRDVDKPKLQAIADFLKAYPQTPRSRSPATATSAARSNTTWPSASAAPMPPRAYLTGLGVAEARLSTISYGKEKPEVQGHDEESWLINRNCQFTLQ